MKNFSVLTLTALLMSATSVSAQEAHPTAPVGDTSEVSQLKAQLNSLMHRIQKLEKEQKNYEHVDHENYSQLEKKIQKVELENAALKLAEKNTVKGGSLPGSILLPGTNTSLKIQGYVKMDVIRESRLIGGDDSSDMQSSFGDIPLKGSPTWSRGGEIGFTAKETRLGFVTDTPTPRGQIGTLIEIDFYGSGNYIPRLRKAYIDWKQAQHEVRFGKDSTTFSDGDATNSAEILDFGGIVGSPGQRLPVVRYTNHCSPHCDLLVALEHTETGYIDTSKTSDKTKDLKTQGHTGGSAMERMPAFVLGARWGNDQAHVYTRATVFEQRISGATAAGDRSTGRKYGYGIANSGHWDVTKDDTLTYDITWGCGLGRWMTGGTGAAFIAEQDKFILQNNLGLSASYKHQWTDTVRSTIGVGYLRTYNKNLLKEKQTNRWIRDIHMNVVSSPVKNLSLGVEYGFGQRKVEKALDVNAKNTGHTHRLQFSAKYGF